MLSNLKFFGAIFLFALGLIYQACSSSEKSDSSPAKEFYLFYTNDISGELDLCGCPKRPMGGIARRAKYIQRYFELKKPVLQVDAGNSFFSQRYLVSKPDDFARRSAEILAKACAKLKVDAINLGISDLAGGIDFLKHLKKLAKEKGELNLISSNLYYKVNNQPVFPRFQLVNKAGIKIGIFGLVKKSTLLPGEVKAGEPLLTAREMTRILREKNQADLVIGLFNLGLEQSKKICREIAGIDIVVVSGSPRYLWEPVLVGNCLLLQAGAGGKYLGEMLIKPEVSKKKPSLKELKSLDAQLSRLDAQIKILKGPVLNDPEVKKKYLELKAERDKVSQELKELSLSFDYQNQLIPLDATLPVDVEIKSWIVQLLSEKKK